MVTGPVNNAVLHQLQEGAYKLYYYNYYIMEETITIY